MDTIIAGNELLGTDTYIHAPPLTELYIPEEFKTNSVKLAFDTNGAMPEIIKKNFIYRKVWREVFVKDCNATFIVIGKPGIGKSCVAQKMCLDLDPTFNHERICYDLDSFLELLDKGDSHGELKPGNCILFDEIVTDRGADSRSSMSRTNKIMNYVTATFRAKRLIVFYCLPSLTQLDKNIRDINITGIFEILTKSLTRRKNYCKFTWSKYDAKTQKVFYVYPRLVNKTGQIFKIKGTWIGLPPKDFENVYKEKKMRYLKMNIARWNASVKKDNKEKKDKTIDDTAVLSAIRINPAKYLLSGRYNSYLIKKEHGIGSIRASSLAGFLNKELKENVFTKSHK
jgi:hypothetical protein